MSEDTRTPFEQVEECIEFNTGLRRENIRLSEMMLKKSRERREADPEESKRLLLEALKWVTIENHTARVNCAKTLGLETPTPKRDE